MSTILFFVCLFVSYLGYCKVFSDTPSEYLALTVAKMSLSLFFFFFAAWLVGTLVGSQLPDQGLNPGHSNGSIES